MPITTAGDLVAFALRTAGINGVGQNPSHEDSNDGLILLNAMIAQWARKRWLVWSLVDSFVVSTGAASYTVGVSTPGGTITTAGGSFPTSPVGLAPGTIWSDGGVLAIVPGGPPIWPASVPATVVAGNGAFAVARPDRIESAFVRLLNSPGPNYIDYPLAIIESREDYNEIGLKSLTTFPAAVWYESTWPTGVLHFWPIPVAGMFELHISTKQALPFYALTTPISMPPEYTEALIYSLAARLCLNYGQDPKPSLVGAMRAALNTLRQANTQISDLDLPSFGARRGSVAASSSPAFQTGWW